MQLKTAQMGLVVAIIAMNGCISRSPKNADVSYHVSNAYEVDSSKTGEHLAALDGEGRLVFFANPDWHRTTSDRLRLRRFSLSPLGNEAVAAAGTNRLIWVNSESGRVTGSLELPVTNTGYPRFSSTGSQVAIATGGVGTVTEGPCKVYVIDSASKKVTAVLRTFIADGSRNAMCFSPDGKLLAVGGLEHAGIYEVASGKLLVEWRKPFVDGYIGGWVKNVCFSRDGKSALFGGDNFGYRFLAPKWEVGERYSVPGSMVSVGALLKPGQFWIASSYGKVYRIGFTGAPKQTHDFRREWCYDVAYSANAQTWISSWEGDDVLIGKTKE